jgi:pimeloyl-ACP methyl ester carboxylesterase
VILLVMGTSTQGIGWPDELVETLIEGGRQVLRFDHRDTGQSDCVDFAAAPYTLTDMAADALAVMDGHQVPAAHVAGASMGGTIGQLLATHHPERVLTLTAIMTSPMGYNAGPAWARALAGQDPEPGDLPPPAPQFLQHIATRASSQPASRDERITVSTETWRVLNGTTLPFGAEAARRHIEDSYARARDIQAATHHDLAGRQMTSDRQALAALIPGARFQPVPGMGHGFFSPGLPGQIARTILEHTARSMNHPRGM